MKIKNKYILMTWPVKAIVFIPAIIFATIAFIAFAVRDWLEEYDEWCSIKSGMFIQNENGIWIYNPKYLEEKNASDKTK